MTWAEGLRRTYFGNATAVRDYRVQLRSSRAILLFGAYLGTLIAVAYAVYSQQAQSTQTSVVEAQQMLGIFYTTVMGLLGGMVTLIAPALSATTIAVERQRQSFDLVFSAPVTPKYYLVGKVISSYRFVWMILVLSLPVTAASVVLGGATWSDVLVSYLLLSFHGLVFTSFALLMSTLAPKPVQAVSWTYGAVLFYFMFGAGSLPMALFGMMTGREQFFTIALNPIMVTQAADTYMVILGREIPNWFLAGIACLVLVRLALLSAGAILSPYGGIEAKSLRLNILVLVFGLGMMVGYLNTQPLMGLDEDAGKFLFWSTLPFLVTLPLMTCFSYEGERVHWHDGLFRWRRFLKPTPGGALPYVYAVSLAGTLGILVGSLLIERKFTQANLFAYTLFTAGFWTLFWGFGRFASISQSLRSARTLVFASFLMLTVIPIPFLMVVSFDTFSEPLPNLWLSWVLYPLFRDTSELPLLVPLFGVIMLVAGWMLAVRAERIYTPKIRQDLVNDERVYGEA